MSKAVGSDSNNCDLHQGKHTLVNISLNIYIYIYIYRQAQPWSLSPFGPDLHQQSNLQPWSFGDLVDVMFLGAVVVVNDVMLMFLRWAKVKVCSTLLAQGSIANFRLEGWSLGFSLCSP